jgi:hypothetical protein
VLAVVVIERIPADADQPADGSFVGTDTLGRIVNELIGVHGLDLHLIDQFPSTNSVSSEPARLSLESINGPIAVLAWYDPEKSFRRWSESGLPGFRSRHQDDLEGPSTGTGRPLYFFNLCRNKDSEPLLQSLQKIAHSSSIPVVSLGGRPSSPASPRVVSGADSQTQASSIRTPPATTQMPLPTVAVPVNGPRKAAPSDETLQSWANKLDEFDV